jgi:hypothetical protein
MAGRPMVALAIVVVWFRLRVGAMQYDLLRLVLAQREQLDMLGRRGPEGRPLSREQWLRAVLAEPIEFAYYGNTFHFVPEPEEVPSSLFILGRIGREYHAIEHEPPEAGLVEVLHDAWTAATIIVDPTSHEDGQKVAFEVVSRVGKPLRVLEALLGAINGRVPKEPYVAQVNPIVDPATFWEFEEENRGEITFIEFDLLAPNMFGTRNDLDKELKELRDHEKARKAKLELENEDGLNLNTDRTRQTVGYTLEGGGAIKARTKRKRKRFDSRRSGRRITVEPQDAGHVETFFSKVGRVITRVFGQ